MAGHVRRHRALERKRGAKADLNIWARAQSLGLVFSLASDGSAETGSSAFRGAMRTRIASEAAMPARAPALASNPAQNALPMTAFKPGAIGKRNPITMQAREVRIRNRALATTLTAPRLAPAARKLAYHRRAKTAIEAATRMDGPLFFP
jgi:hypothetical protein